MGTFSILVKLTVVLLVLTVSYLFVWYIVAYAQWVPSFIGLRSTQQGQLVSYAEDTLALFAAAVVGVCFTMPLLLATSGHAGSWFKYVVSRSVKHLSVGLAGAFAVYVAASAASGISLGIGGVAQGLKSTLVVGSVCLLLVVLISRSTVLKGVAGVVEGGLSSARFVGSSIPLGRRKWNVATIELRVTPMRQIRDKDKPDKIRVEMIRYQRFVQTLSTLGDRVEFRLSFREGRGKVLISARGRVAKGELQQRLLAIVRSHLPEFKADISEAPPEVPGRVGHCLRISGVPDADENPLEPLARYFIGNSADGDYQIILEKARGNPLRRFSTRGEQKKSAERAGGQKAELPTIQGEQLSSTVRDYAEEVKLEDSIKQLERHHSSLALRCSAYVTAYADNAPSAAIVAKGASSMIVGALSNHRSASALKIGKVKGRVLQLETKGRPTLMLPKEAPFPTSGFRRWPWAAPSYPPPSSSCPRSWRGRYSWGG